MASKKRTVVRKYFSKRKNEWVTKTYEYNVHKAKRSDLIVGRTGKIYKDRLNALRSTLNTDDQYELDLLILHQQAKAERGQDSRISERTLRSMLSESKIEKAIINTGYSVEELADELGISVADLLDENNWDGSTFTFGGSSWDFEFRYEGDIMVKHK